MNFFSKIIYFTLFITSLNAQHPLTLKNVSIQLSWFNQFQFAGYYMAKELGYYEDLGLNVTIIPFKFGLNIPKEVNENKINFSIGRETLILQKESYKNIVSLYALFQATPLVLLTTKESNIKNISDFENKTIMTTKDDASEVSIKAMISSQNIQEKDLIFLQHTHNIEDLINKKTDIISAYVSKEPFYLKEQNIAYNIFEPKNYGFDMYSDILYTNKYLLTNNQEIVDSFIKASLKGWKYAYKHIEEATNLILNNYNEQNLSKEELIFEAKELKKLSYYKTDELGKFTKTKLKSIYDIYKVMGLVKQDIDINKFIYKKESSTMSLSTVEQNFLKRKRKITMCIDPDFMPYEKINQYGLHKGISSEIFKIFQSYLSVPIKLIKTTSWEDSLLNSQNKKCDILSLTIPRKSSYLSFSNPYLKVSLVLATSINVPFIDDFEQIKGRKIALVKSYGSKEIIKKHYPYFNIVEVSTIEEGLNKITRGEVFGLIENAASIAYLFQNKSFPDLKISGKFDNNLNLSIGVRKDEPILLNIFNKLIYNLKEKEKKDILNKYVNINYEQQFNTELILKAFALASMIILAILYRHFLLKKVNSNLKKNIEEKTKELKELNNNLEIKILKEVERSKKMQNQLFKSEKMASMGEMIGNIAHQWRQPLSAITTLSTGLKLQKELGVLEDETFLDNMDLINENAQYLSKTIDDFRNFIKDERQQVSFNLKDKINSFLHLVQTSIKEYQITIDLNISSDIIINGYPNELLQCLINIFNNAKDVVKNNQSEERFVFIEAYENKNNIVIKIKDNGGGIDEKYIDKIYEPYFTTKGKTRGTGLGLNMVYKIINEGMKGSIEALNTTYTHLDKEYKGALFIITIPKLK